LIRDSDLKSPPANLAAFEKKSSEMSKQMKNERLTIKIKGKES
jgi:hypothetical protein